jgi:hypothetical protein
MSFVLSKSTTVDHASFALVWLVFAFVIGGFLAVIAVLRWVVFGPR